MDITEHTIAEARSQLQLDILALMERFEATGMDRVMADDYQSLYTLYQHAQAVEE